MLLGGEFFVTPSDSVAIIAATAQEAIPYFQSGPKVGNLYSFFNIFPHGQMHFSNLISGEFSDKYRV
mgnify:CR=1 FL=1